MSENCVIEYRLKCPSLKSGVFNFPNREFPTYKFFNGTLRISGTPQQIDLHERYLLNNLELDRVVISSSKPEDVHRGQKLEHIKSAVMSFDPEDDSLWNSKGLPLTDSVQESVPSKYDVSRKDIVDVGVTRSQVRSSKVKNSKNHASSSTK